MSTSDLPESASEPDDFDQLAHELVDLLKVTPPGDHPIVAEHLATGVVVSMSTALADIRMMVDVHQDMAPVSAHRVMTFAQAAAQATLAWVKGLAQ
ncbi:hypothetical protein ACFYTQ_27790 [Nocardia sp. NPDC004068]|uniref:hypothetical protein n=1 Tax=Nocardia sp. NPDC004068 TaxID=3364303 RepID=UPI003683561C